MMGYYTRFSLEWTAQNWKPPPACGHENGAKAKFCQECGQAICPAGLDSVVGAYIKNHENMSYVMTESGDSQDTAKWYDYEQDMRAMSREIPGVLFKLSGEGENSGDIWVGYALDGKWQKHKAKIVVDDCNPKAWT